MVRPGTNSVEGSVSAWGIHLPEALQLQEMPEDSCLLQFPKSISFAASDLIPITTLGARGSLYPLLPIRK